MATTKKINKKSIRTDLQHQLANSLPELKKQLGKGRFENNIKRASKVLLKGLKKSSAISSKISVESNDAEPAEKTA